MYNVAIVMVPHRHNFKKMYNFLSQSIFYQSRLITLCQPRTKEKAKAVWGQSGPALSYTIILLIVISESIWEPWLFGLENTNLPVPLISWKLIYLTNSSNNYLQVILVNTVILYRTTVIHNYALKYAKTTPYIM